MNIITHALAPVVICHLAFGRRKWLGKYGLIAIGVAGALPTPFSPPSGPATGSFNGLNPKSKFLAAILPFSVSVFSVSALPRPPFSPATPFSPPPLRPTALSTAFTPKANS